MKIAIYTTLLFSALASNLSSAQDSSFFKTYDYPATSTIFNSSTRTLDGNFLQAGSIDDKGLITKTDTNGHVIWAKKYPPSSFNNEIEFHKIAATNEGNYILLGKILTYTPFSQVITLTKIDAVGNVIWNKVFPDTNSSFNLEYTDGLLIDGNNYLIAAAGYIAKTDTSGTVIWSKIINNVDVRGCGLAIGSDGNYFYSSNEFGSDIKVVKLDTNGNMLWNKIIDFDNGKPNYCSAVISTADSGLIAIGTIMNSQQTERNLIYVKLDKDGNIIWSKEYSDPNNNCYISTIARANDGGFYIGGGLYLNPLCHALLIKIDSAGNIEWSQISDHGSGTIWTNQILISGNFAYFFGIDQPAGNIAMIFKTPINGVSSCIMDYGLTQINVPTSSSSGITITNSVLNTPLPLNSIPINLNELTLCNSEVGINEYDWEKEYSIFPVPFQVSFQIKGLQPNDQIQIFNILGEDVTDQTQINNENVEAGTISAGIYFLKIKTKNGIYSTKIIKE